MQILSKLFSPPLHGAVRTKQSADRGELYLSARDFLQVIQRTQWKGLLWVSCTLSRYLPISHPSPFRDRSGLNKLMSEWNKGGTGGDTERKN